MANKVQTPENDLMVETKGKLELFFDKHGSKILWIIIIVGLAFSAYFIFKNYSDGRQLQEEQAASIAMGNELSGAKSVEGYDKVQEEYEGTAAANTSAYLAGAAALQAGDLAKAEAELAKYVNVEGAAGEMLNAKVLGLKGDIAVEKDQLDEAAKYFAEAAQASDDEHTFVTYTKKLALVYAAQNNEAKAQECYKDIVKKYPKQERAMAKYIR
ncbi:MAG: tetratricopeptide repeat protein [Alistipes sp.]|nr:tetratricopeptide repeat protein [Alistipes sp.]